MKYWLSFLIFLIAFSAEAQDSALRLADSLYSTGNYKAAIKLYKTTENQSAKVQQKIAQAQEARGNLSEAIAHYQSALSQNNNLLIAASRYGKALYRNGNHKKADSLFTNLLKRFPKNPDFYYQRGLAKEQLNDSLAVTDFYKSLRQDENHQKALYKVTLFRFKEKDYLQVDSLGSHALKTYPENKKMWSLLAQNAYAQRNYKRAVTRFEQLIDLGYASEFVYEKLGYSYYQLNSFANAIKSFNKVIQLNQENAKVHLQLGKLYNLTGDYKKAEKHLLYALLLTKIPLDEHYQSLGITYKMKKDYKKALHYFSLALEENPKKIRAQYELAIAADNYYKDLQTRLNYYTNFIDKFDGTTQAEPYIILAKRRAQDLKEEIHFDR
ncbi:tetratricopeptide repeat protein [Mesonia aquimarina]|uniref:tetratricopeptide repeat protein n=1 Tax=Mesonia aquimarina TaxID=1504967 RepID=UPI000EF56B37|nr:tetratricopeptide repeat protein [Mesonia aquimarina]